MLRLTELEEGVRLEVRVQPRSSRNQVVGEQNGCLKVKLTAPPVEGEANAALVAFLAEYLHLPRRDVVLVKGDTSRNKIIEIRGLGYKELAERLGVSLSS